MQIIVASNASQLAARCALNLLEQIAISKTVIRAALVGGLPSNNSVKVAANFINAATGHHDEEYECNKAGCVGNSFATNKVGTMFFGLGYLSRHVVITSPFDLQNLVTHLQRHFGKGQMGSDKA